MTRAGKRIALTAVAVVLLGSSYPIYEAGVTFNIWQPLTRPAGVSRRAHYVDAFKSAAWFDCDVDAHRNVDVCRVWDDRGRLIAAGDYRIDSETRAATWSELHPWVVIRGPHDDPGLAWIYISRTKNRPPMTLVPVNNAGQPLERFEVR